MIACRSNICCSLDLQEEHVGTAASPWRRPIGPQAPRLPATRMYRLFLRKATRLYTPPRLALVKRECQELGGQRNWLLTRLSRPSRRNIYAEPMAESPECVRRRRMLDYRHRLDDLLRR
jgi:hypothetical protein